MNLPACSPQPPINAERQAGKLRMPFFKVFWYDSTRGMNPRSTDCKADALTTTPCYCWDFENESEFYDIPKLNASVVVLSATGEHKENELIYEFQL